MDEEIYGTQDTSTLDGESDTLTDTENEEVVESDDSAKAEELAKNYRIRAERAEAEAKKLRAEVQKKAEQTVQPKIESTAPSVDPDELRLLAKGLSDDEIEQAKVLAKGKDISLMEALKDPMFVSYQKDLKEQQKREKAKLGASKGSGESEEDTLIKSGMTREDHLAAWKKMMGK